MTTARAKTVKCWISSFGENAVIAKSTAAPIPTTANLRLGEGGSLGGGGSTTAAATGAGATETSTGGGGQVDDHAAGPHRGHHVPGDQPRGRPAGDQRGGDDDVDVRRLFGVHDRRAAVEVLAHLAGVAVGADFLLARRHGHVVPAQG